MVSLATVLLALCGCSGNGIMDTYWRDNKTGEWLIGLTEGKLIYDCKIWDIASMDKSDGTYSMTARCGMDSLAIGFGSEKGGKRIVSIGDKQFNCSLIKGRHLPDYPQKDTCTTIADNHYAEGDSVTIVGWVKPKKGLFASAENGNIGKNGTVSYMVDIFTGEETTFTFPIDSLGRFTLCIPIENTKLFWLEIGQDSRAIAAYIVAEPGETYFLMKDYSQSKTLFMGNNARLLNEINTHSITTHGFEFSELMEIGDLNGLFDTIRNNTKLGLQKLDDVCREHPTLSERYRIFLRNRILIENARYVMIGRYMQPNRTRELPEDFIKAVDEEYLQEFDEPYTMYSYAFSHFLAVYILDLTMKAQNNTETMESILESAEKDGLFKLTAKDREAIRQYDEAFPVMLEERKNVPDSLQKVLDEEFGKKDFVKAVLEIQARNPKYSDYSLKRLDLHLMAQMKKEMDARGLSETLQDIILSQHLCRIVNSTCNPFGKEVLACADESIHIPAARNAVHAINEKYLKYLQIGQHDFSNEDNLKSNDIVKGMSDGEIIFRKLIEPYKGKFILVDIWGTWCSPCRMLLQHSQEEYERLKDFDIVYLYLADKSSDKVWKKLIKEYQVEGENVVHYNLPAQQQTAIENFLGVRGFPTYRLIDRDGTILDVNADPTDLEALAGLLERLN